MEPCTMNRDFERLDVIEEFYSLIWTERYYGDSEVELTIPLQASMITKLAEGSFLSIRESTEPMIIETVNIEDGKIKVMGVSILKWLNNRFIRNSPNHRKTTWKFKQKTPGQVLWTVVKEMCTEKSSYLNPPYKDMGLTNAQAHELIIPGLKLGAEESAGKKIKKILVPYGPVYDSLRKIAEQYKIGMQIYLGTDLSIKFRSYKGANRTTGDTIVRFSPVMDSLSDVKEVRSIAEFKTLIYSFAASLEKIDTADANDNPDTWLQTRPGIARRAKGPEGKYTGFDLRAKMIFPGDITIKQDLDEEDDSGPESTLSGKREELRDVLDNRAEKELKQNEYIRAVDGTVAPTNAFQYKVDYDLGDIVQIQGNTGLTENSRVIEYIRTQDASGEVSYPTIEAIEA